MGLIHDKTARRLAKRALVVHRTLDALVKPVARFLEAKCPNEPGCSACCNKVVEMNLLDALALANYVYTRLPNRIRFFEEKATALSKKFRECNDSTEWFEEQNGCVFLNEAGGCDAYPVRPTTCRTFFAVTEPKQCLPKAEGKYGTIDTTPLEDTSTRAAIAILKSEGMGVAAGPVPDMFLLALEFYRNGTRKLGVKWEEGREALYHAIDLYKKEKPPNKIVPTRISFNPGGTKMLPAEERELEDALGKLKKLLGENAASPYKEAEKSEPDIRSL